MQPRAWYVIAPNGQRHGPSYTERQAQLAAVKIALKGREVDDKTALGLFKAMPQVGWKIVRSLTKDIKP
jgi:hypothetical protein